jgi:alkaline phosphatase D
VSRCRGYRDLYAGYRSDPLLKEMHRLCPWIVTWDDHEVQNNYTGNLSNVGDTDFETLRIAGYRAYYEHMPLRARAMMGALERFRRDARLQIYDRYDFGRRARFHVLDARQYRTPPLCAPTRDDNAVSCVNEDAFERDILGSRREQWLDQGLAEGAGVAWNIICQQPRFTTGAYLKGEGSLRASYCWDGYPAARERLTSMIERHAPRRSLIMGGDIHLNWVEDVHARPFDVSSPVVAAEFTGTSLSSLSGQSQKAMDRARAANPHCKLANAHFRRYGVVELTPQNARVTLRTVDARAEQLPSLGTLARFRMRRGHGRAEETD